MTQTVTNFLDLPVYTANGKYVGRIGNVILDLQTQSVASLLVTGTNPALVDGGMNVAVPYRWVSAVGDIVILSNFPDRVEIAPETENDLESELEKEITA
ncbi:MAG: PRC-barrel domain-containing protein [Euryarchaeota archaeon]|nr:PRC-barrel domain-containing protein [Euryarchaeota archaeon]